MALVRTEAGDEEGETVFFAGEDDVEVARISFPVDDDNGLRRADQLALTGNVRGLIEKLLRSRWYADES